MLTGRKGRDGVCNPVEEEAFLLRTTHAQEEASGGGEVGAASDACGLLERENDQIQKFE